MARTSVTVITCDDCGAIEDCVSVEVQVDGQSPFRVDLCPTHLSLLADLRERAQSAKVSRPALDSKAETVASESDHDPDASAKQSTKRSQSGRSTASKTSRILRESELRLMRVTLMDYLRSLSRDENFLIRAAVASRHCLPEDLFNELAEDMYVVREAVGANTAAPTRLLATLATDEAYIVRVAVSENPRAPLPALRTLVAQPDRDVREAIARNPSLPVDLLVDLIDLGFKADVASNTRLPKPMIREFASDADDHVRAAIGGNRSTPPELTLALSEDPSWVVRKMVGSNPRTPTEVLRKLAAERDEDVCTGIAWNTSAPGDLLTSIHKRFGMHGLLAGNTATPTKILAKLAEGDTEVRELLASNPSAPLPTLEELCFDPELTVQIRARCNPSMLAKT